MNNQDDFDVFLRKELENSTQIFRDDEFKQKVLKSLPEQINRNRLRNLIITISGILSCLVFFLVIDPNVISNLLMELYYLISETVVPSLETILLITMILFIFYIIPRVEFSHGVS